MRWASKGRSVPWKIFKGPKASAGNFQLIFSVPNDHHFGRQIKGVNNNMKLLTS